ncbi:nucleotidyl transferase AbiEii/AbiGii toxin family protein [Bradyrhizobium sp. 2TAF24]|uniref:nucleotidyl transferase AbiEii/AbiGii toxin family protein n=1 Tax=Bradyrhizobium sp. 2TAF24 TaxID=3233011 RepID=UPI003F90E811
MSTNGPDWARLLRIARALIRQVNAEHVVIDSWSLGGGTAMMLQLDHRDSQDIDIFLPDAQLLSFLDPRLHDFQFEIAPSDYGGDGSKFLKLAFAGIGEIDFIVGQAVTAKPTMTQTVKGEDIALETVAEIIAKKICYRGATIKPRDIFDIAVAAQHDRSAIVGALRDHPDGVAKTLRAMERLKPDFVNAAIAALSIKDRFKPVASTALADAREVLTSV